MSNGENMRLDMSVRHPQRSSWIHTSAFCLLVAGAALSATRAWAELLTIHYISAAAANDAVREAVSVCAQQGYAVTATVVDQNANRLAVLRGDGAGSHTADVSWGKAYGAVSYAPIYGQEDSGSVGKLKLSQSGASFQVPEHMVLRGGGITVKYGSEVIGAIGVSGSPGAELDDACAHAGYDKIKASYK
jgi:uncharacterized protein GlcG (DUF336 family)